MKLTLHLLFQLGWLAWEWQLHLAIYRNFPRSYRSWEKCPSSYASWSQHPQQAVCVPPTGDYFDYYRDGSTAPAADCHWDTGASC